MFEEQINAFTPVTLVWLSASMLCALIAVFGKIDSKQTETEEHDSWANLSLLMRISRQVNDTTVGHQTLQSHNHGSKRIR